MIPNTSPVYKELESAAKNAKAVVISGMPGVGKSLYINQFKDIALQLEREVIVIQWDVARKAFETPEIAKRFPTGDGEVHNGLKLSVGKWLVDTFVEWIAANKEGNGLLLIEAPLVGHRFVELMHKQSDKNLENILTSDDFQVIVPIPSKEIRHKIEQDRNAQVSENAKDWSGAKPSVMLLLWKEICGIANEMGKTIPMDGQPPYDPDIYKFVFGEILKHRHFKALYIDEIFPVTISDEKELHECGSIQPDSITANHYARIVMNEHITNDSIDTIVNGWYKT